MKIFVSAALFAVGALAGAQTLSYTTIVRGMVDSTLIQNQYQDDPELKETAVHEATGNAIARAQIAPGVNKVWAHFDSLDANNPSYTLMADAQTYWTDEVTISDPELDGTVGTFTASLRVFGSDDFNLTGVYADEDIDTMADVYGFWDSWIGTSTDGGGSYLVGGWFGSWYSFDNGEVWYFGDELNQPMTEVTLEFIYGQPFLLRMNLEAYFDAENSELLPGTVEGTLDFSHSAYWNGIGGIFDSNGNAVNPTFQSASGIDWRNSVVPEPAILIAVGVGLAGLVRRRR